MHLKPHGNDLDTSERAEIITYLPALKGKKILELASGVGRFTHHLSTVGSHVTAVDFAPQFIEKSRLELADRKNITYLCADVMDLEFADNSFDFVFFNWLLMYLEDDEVELLLARIHRWLKPQGELFFRESCQLIRTKNTNNGYYATYRTLADYDTLVKKNYILLKDGSIKTYAYYFSDPFQCFWHCRK